MMQPKAGARTSEYQILLFYIGICILSGLGLSETGTLTYEANQVMLDSLLYVVLGYGGYRTAIKGVTTWKSGGANAEEVAQSVLKQLQKDRAE